MLELCNPAVSGPVLCGPEAWLSPLHTATVKTFPQGPLSTVCLQLGARLGRVLPGREVEGKLGGWVQAEGGRAAMAHQGSPGSRNPDQHKRNPVGLAMA